MFKFVTVNLTKAEQVWLVWKGCQAKLSYLKKEPGGTAEVCKLHLNKRFLDR